MGDISFGEYNNELWWFKRGTAGVTFKGFRCGNINMAGHLNLLGDSNLCNFSLSNTDKRWILRKAIVGWETIMSVGGAGEDWVDIPRAGDITMLDDKFIDCLSGNFLIPSWTVAADVLHNCRYRASTDAFEIYDGAAWQAH